MISSKIQFFSKGVHNLLGDEIIPKEALQDSKNWINQDGVLKLVNGKIIVGTEGVAGKNRGLWKGYKVDGTVIFFRKNTTLIEYFDGTTWQTTITGLTLTAEYSFANYSSLAGNFVLASGIDGLYKINTANPASYCSLYSKQSVTGAAGNDKGKIMIDKGRLIMWDCADASKTILKLSWVDGQDSDVYTAVTGEATASLGGTLAFKAGSALRNCFGAIITLTVSGEVYSDNKDGTLTGSLGGTGTINYISGAYTISNAGVGTVNYSWENSNSKGITDFSFNVTTRVAGTGNLIMQNIGGDAIQSVLIGQDGNYYSLKKNSAYQLAISADDTTFTNLVYNSDMGIPFFRAGVSTVRGIVFINTANPDKPELTILEKNILGNIVPTVLFPQFKFSNYSYDDCCIDTWERYIVIACQSSDSDFNDTILLCDIANKTVDIGAYPARTFAKDAGVLYAGSPITDSVHKIFNGFDDEGFVIDNFAILKGETYGSENLKKFRKLKIQGLIEPDQDVGIYISYDDADFQLIGTIDGRGGYVDLGTPRTVGSNMVGTVPIGGDNAATVYPFFYGLDMATPKFRKRELKFIATGIGYVQFNSVEDENILIFENRLPSRYRTKKV